MKKLFFTIFFLVIFSVVAYCSTAVLKENLDLHLPDIEFQGEKSGIEADFEYNEETNAWHLTRAEEKQKEHTILNKINEIRDTPLEWDDNLMEAALIHSKDMYENNFFSHTGSDGSSFSDRISRTDFSGWPRGENIAQGRNPFVSWKNSQGHYRNMVDSTATHIGYSEYKGYHTMVTGVKR